jgi:hypothetical protein
MEATQNVRYCCGSVRHYKRADNLLGAAPNALTVVSDFSVLHIRPPATESSSCKSASAC